MKKLITLLTGLLLLVVSFSIPPTPAEIRAKAQEKRVYVQKVYEREMAKHYPATQLVDTSGYWVSSSGSDSNNGTSKATSWLTVSKVNTEIAAGNIADGDSVFFAKNDTFQGQLVIANKTFATNVYIGAYGSGAAPIIEATKTISGTWTSRGSNIWKIHDNTLGTRLRMLSIGGVRKEVSKYPESTFLDYTSNGASRYISHYNAGYPTGTWDQAIEVPKTSLFTIEPARISTQVDSVMTHSWIIYPTAKVCKFFFADHVKCLELNPQAGAWAYNPSNDTLYVYSTTDPNDLTIKASYYTSALRIRTSNHIKISGVGFQFANDTLANIYGSDHITLDNVSGKHGGFNGVHLYDSHHFTGSNLNLDEIGNKGIIFELSDTFFVDDISLTNVGLRKELGEPDGATTTAVSFKSSVGGTFRHAYIRNVAYNGISVINPTVRNLLVDSSFITRCGLTKTDGAGVYTWSDTDGVEANNVIDHVICTDMQNDSGLIMADNLNYSDFTDFDCFYSDDNSSYITYSNCTGFGGFRTLYLHSSHNITVYNNLMYGGEFDVLTLEDSKYNTEMFNNTISGNVFAAKYPASGVGTPRLIYFGYLGNWATGTHTGDNNASVLTPSVGIYEANQAVTNINSGRYMSVRNTTDGSAGNITANTTTTVTATLSGGAENDWDTGDAYIIDGELYSGTVTFSNNYFMHPWVANDQGGSYPNLMNSYQCNPPLATHSMNYNTFTALSYVTGEHSDPIKYASSGITRGTRVTTSTSSYDGFEYFRCNPTSTAINVDLSTMLTGEQYFVNKDGTDVGTSISVPAYGAIILYKRL